MITILQNDALTKVQAARQAAGIVYDINDPFDSALLIAVMEAEIAALEITDVDVAESAP